MLSSGIIDLAIGLAFAFGVTAALASVVTELISRFLGLRGAYLLRGLQELLDGTGGTTVVNEAERDFTAMRPCERVHSGRHHSPGTHGS